MLTVLTVEEALKKILNLPRSPSSPDELSLSLGLGRVLAEDILSLEKYPQFSRATMDGYALQAQDSFGASESMPALLKVIDQVAMGEEANNIPQPGEAVRIATGGMLPEGTDAVVMLEYVDSLGGDEIAVYRSVAPGDNVIKSGEDYERDEIVLKKGHRLRPQDLGLLAALGVSEVKVSKKPRVAILSTGDELVELTEKPGPGKIRDVNSTALAALTQKAGGIPLHLGITPDDESLLRQGIKKGLKGADLVIVSGGSSVGARDYTAKIVDSLEGDGVLFHGLSIRPGKPLIFGFSHGKAIFGLSGNPVSAMLTFQILVIPYLRALQGCQPLEKYPKKVKATLTRNLSSSGGRQDYIRVNLKENGEGWLAEPIFGGSGLLRTMVQADGYLVIPRGKEGMVEGEEVNVYIFS